MPTRPNLHYRIIINGKLKRELTHEKDTQYKQAYSESQKSRHLAQVIGSVQARSCLDLLNEDVRPSRSNSIIDL